MLNLKLMCYLYRGVDIKNYNDSLIFHFMYNAILTFS